MNSGAATTGILRPLGNGLLTVFMKRSSIGRRNLKSMHLGLMGLASNPLDASAKIHLLFQPGIVFEFRVRMTSVISSNCPFDSEHMSLLTRLNNRINSIAPASTKSLAGNCIARIPIPVSP